MKRNYRRELYRAALLEIPMEAVRRTERSAIVPGSSREHLDLSRSLGASSSSSEYRTVGVGLTSVPRLSGSELPWS